MIMARWEEFDKLLRRMEWKKPNDCMIDIELFTQKQRQMKLKWQYFSILISVPLWGMGLAKKEM